jgi:hypothetical protein
MEVRTLPFQLKGETLIFGYAGQVGDFEVGAPGRCSRGRARVDQLPADVDSAGTAGLATI